MGSLLLLRGVRSGTRLLNDTYTDPDATLITAHTMDLGPGYTCAGAPTIVSNKATFTAATGVYQPAVAQANQANIDLSMDVTGSFDSGLVYSLPAAVVRYLDDNNFWMIQLYAGGIYLYEKAAGVLTQRATAAQTTTSGTVYALRVVALGTTITAYVDGVLKITYASAASSQTETKHGWVIVRDGASAAHATIDNLLVIST